MKKLNRAVLPLALCLMFSGLALAQDPAPMTPENEAVMTRAYEEFNTATSGLRKQIFAKESALNAQIYGENPDDASVNALVGEINALHAKIYTERVAMRKKLAKENIFPEPGRHGMRQGGCAMMDCMGGQGKRMDHMQHQRPGRGSGHGGHNGKVSM